MKIMFVAKHDCGDNQDEDAVAYALEKLGHEVIKVHELQRHRKGVDPLKIKADMCLFFKWESYFEVAELSKRMPVISWYFDLISSEDPTLAKRMEFRRMWYQRLLPHMTLMFFTDGDWVDRQCGETDKCRWLMQGMDERVAGLGTPLPHPQPPILFTGTPHHGRLRYEQIHDLQHLFKDKMQVIGEGGPRGRIHGRALSDLFASVRCVIAPIGPVSDCYWSNRVYLTTGLGGALLHPRSKGVERHYNGTEVCYYHGQDLPAIIDRFLSEPQEWIDNWRKAGYERTMHEHTYYHRCIRLMKMIQEVI